MNKSEGGIRKVWLSNPKKIESIVKNRESALKNRIAYAEPPRILNMNLSSDLYLILSKISKNTKLCINIPETVVCGYGFRTPTFMYTNPSGVLKIKQKLNPMHLETIYKIFELHRQCSKKSFPTPLAIIKSPVSACSRVIMKASELLNEFKSVFKSEVVIQRYIIPKGSKAYKIRQFCSDSVFTYFNISNNLRLDAKQDRKPEKPKSVKKVMPRVTSVGTTQNNQTTSKGNSFIMRENSLVHQYEDFEILNQGQKYLDDKTMAMELVELGAFEIPFTFFKKPRKKIFEPRVSSNIRNVIVISKNKMSELDKYLQDVWVSSKFVENTLEGLFKELKSFDSVTNIDYGNKEEITVSNSVVNKLRSMFLIDSNSGGRISTFEIIGTSAFSVVETWSNTLKGLISCNFLVKSGEHIENLVLEFCEDFLGNIFFLKIKSFSVKKHALINPSLHSISTEFKCPGKFCNKRNYTDECSDTTSTIDYKPKVFKILLKTLEESEGKIENLIKSNFERVVEVCQKCFYEYMKIEKGKLKKVQKSGSLMDVNKFRFSQAIGRLKYNEVAKDELNAKPEWKKSTLALKFCTRKKELVQASRLDEFLSKK